MKNQHVAFRKNPLFEKCPSCKTVNTLHRSRARNWKEALLKNVTHYKTYRCKSCGWRGNLSTLTISTNSIKLFLIYITLGLVSAFIVLQVIRRLG